MGKNSDHILSRLWTKVYKILERCRRPAVVSYAPARLFMACFVLDIFTIKSRSHRYKMNKCNSLEAPIFLGGTTPTCLRQIVSTIYYPPFRQVCLNSVCKAWQWSRIQI